MDKILIIVDMQEDFIDGALGSPEAQAVLPKVCEKIKNWDSKHMVYTLDTHEAEFYFNTEEGKRIPQHCLYTKNGWYLHDDIQDALTKYENRPPYPVVKCVTKDTFGSINELPAQIEELISNNPFEIHICGLCTDICVISNALILRAAFPYARIIVDAQCCAGTTPEQHQAALNVMKACCIEVINEN